MLEISDRVKYVPQHLGANAAVEPFDHEQEALAPFTVSHLQLRYVLVVDMNGAKVEIARLALALVGTVGRKLWPAVQPFRLQDPTDAVALEVRQETANSEGEVVEQDVSGAVQGANHGTLLSQPEKISRRVAPGAHAVVTLDGAGWHKIGGRLTVPNNISLLPLPPYSPELNPQENVWQYLRQNYLANRVFETYEAIVDACCEDWNSLTAFPERIPFIATRKWAEQVKA